MTQPKKVVYIAHPLGQGEDREKNRLNAQRWAVYFAEAYGIAPVADWTIIAGFWSEERREQGMAIDLALISKVDEVWMCGGRISNGMQIEAAEAVRLGKLVRDFTVLGYDPTPYNHLEGEGITKCPT